MTEPIHSEVWWCEEHQVSLTQCCPDAKSIGWFDTYGIKE